MKTYRIVRGIFTVRNMYFISDANDNQCYFNRKEKKLEIYINNRSSDIVDGYRVDFAFNSVRDAIRQIKAYNPKDKCAFIINLI